MHKILVTGGAGFIGANLCRSLLKKNHKVICLDNLVSGSLWNIKDLQSNPNFTFIKHDICDPISLNVDQIYNLACPASPPSYQRDPIRTATTSALGAINMLELALKTKSRIVQASTSEIYGDPLVHPQPETYWGNVNSIGVRSCYDEGKRFAETLFFDYHRARGLDVGVVRIFNTYGPFMDPDDGRVVSNFICQALTDRDLTIYGDGSQTRSFQFIDDLIIGLELMMNDIGSYCGPVNLGNPVEFTVKQLADLIIKLIPDSLSKIVFKPLPSDDPRQRRPDISLAAERLSWAPTIPLEKGLTRTIEYFQSRI